MINLPGAQYQAQHELPDPQGDADCTQCVSKYQEAIASFYS